MKNVAKLCLISILLGLFIYQSWNTVMKYRAEKTSLQVKPHVLTPCKSVLNKKVTLTDDGSILFPSITICKNEMYNIFDKGLMRKLETGELSVENAKPWLRNRTFSRQNLVRFLSIKTEEGSNKYPCNAVGGPRAGEPCTFPVMYPDCKLIKKNAGCREDPDIALAEYRGCDKKGKIYPGLALWH